MSERQRNALVPGCGQLAQDPTGSRVEDAHAAREQAGRQQLSIAREGDSVRASQALADTEVAGLCDQSPRVRAPDSHRPKWNSEAVSDRTRLTLGGGSEQRPVWREGKRLRRLVHAA